jgi:hypothetical protein
MKPTASAKPASFSFAALIGQRIAGKDRAKLWKKLTPADFNPAVTASYYEGIAFALVAAKLLPADKAKEATGLLSALAVGNQSQIRQLINGDSEKAEAPNVLGGFLSDDEESGDE